MIKLIVQGKPISINSAYTGRRGGKKVLNKKARLYRESCWTSLNSKKAEIDLLVKSFDSKKHGLSMSITSYVPIKDYYLKATPSNGLSQAKGDVDNGLKLIVDFLLNARYAPRGAPVIGIDDKYNTKIFLNQLPFKHKTYITVIEIEVIPLSAIILTAAQLGLLPLLD